MLKIGPITILPDTPYSSLPDGIISNIYFDSKNKNELK
jgi:hypothetical protein